MAVRMDEQPLFSVITVTFNALPALKRTACALLGQTFRSFEHIIVDGGSADGTRQWLESAEIKGLRWISEQDKGLYDAMNKGLRMARGRYVWFINAGDEPFAPNTMDLIASRSLEADAIYGEVMVCDPQGIDLGTRSHVTNQRLPESLTWRSLRRGMVVSHQGFLVRREIAPAYMEGNLCADIDWMIRCLKASSHIVNVQGILARFETGGVSSTRRGRSLVDRYKVLKDHFGFWANLLNHLVILFRALRLSLERKWRIWNHSSA